MNNVTHLECSLCKKKFEAGKVHNLCDCGGPLLVRYDLEKARQNWSRDEIAQTLSSVDPLRPSSTRRIAELPGGGWAQGSLTELLVDHEGIGELRLLLPALGRLARSGAWIALVAPPHLPYAPAFAGAGIDPAQVAVVDAHEEKDRWWAAEQVLRADSAAVLLFWPQSISDS